MEETYEKIIKAAYEIFSTEGYQKASINKIKDKANVSKGAIYHYFKSKEELYLKVLEYFIFEFANTLENIEFPDLYKIRELGLIYIEEYKKNKQMQKFLIDFFLQAMLNKKIKKIMNVFLENSIALIENKIKEMQEKGIVDKNINTNLLAQKIFVTLDSLGMYISIDANVIKPEKLWIDFVDNYLKDFFNAN
ncbi:TetR/AcrR family transcriptional regulator [Marinitoga aeolica]|uniref:TetR/AcrR family transcriptional regulator n=1 Tax=Marinitoga aeolica TaxID=2809031 RepID=A0ABY8PP91_9BACT|nr:TetR/AcrR family transcriptional regulator [Marinitoga aeolica]WGS64461.1 TetR/AcrR family transcriptional regulator [Marinitoga aeolica]